MDVRSVDRCMGDTEAGRPLFGSSGGSHPLARFTDQQETYGAHVVERFVRGLQGLDLVLDLGAGSGRDWELVRRFHPRAQLLAIEAGQEYAAALKGKADRVYVANIERDHLPAADCQADLIIANQILEHTKEIFWIFHEISRCLRVGGHLVLEFPTSAHCITVSCCFWEGSPHKTSSVQ